MCVLNTGTVYAGHGSYYESNYLRDESKEYVPVPVVNGYGEVTFSAGPTRNTTLLLKEASCDQIFTCTSDYLEVMDVTCDKNESIVRLAKTAKNMNAIGNCHYMEIQGNKFEIAEVQCDDANIYLKVTSMVNWNKNVGNYLKIN